MLYFNVVVYKTPAQARALSRRRLRPSPVADVARIHTRPYIGHSCLVTSHAPLSVNVIDLRFCAYNHKVMLE